MSDIVVTINPPNTTDVTVSTQNNQANISIGNAVYPHATTHAPSGLDSLGGYYATTGSLNDVSGYLFSQIGFSVFTTGDQDVSGVKNFYSRPTINGTGVLLSGEVVTAPTGYLTGYVSKDETGAFYPISNPSGYITGFDASPYQTIIASTGISGYFSGEISALKVSTGDLDNRSIRAIFISGEGTKTVTLLRGDYSTISTTFTDISGDFSGPSGYLQDQISGLNSLTGSYITGNVVRPSDTGVFYPTSNPSGYITGVDLNNYATGAVVRPSETGNFIIDSQTGSFYAASNPANYITGVDLSSYALTSSVTGISGYLQAEISALSSQTGSYVTGAVVRPSDTGSFLTTGQTGNFYPRSNPSGYITGIDQVSFLTLIPSGVEETGILFGRTFGSTPRVFPSMILNSPTGYLVGANNITTSGYLAIFSDVIGETGVYLQTLATNL